VLPKHFHPLVSILPTLKFLSPVFDPNTVISMAQKPDNQQRNRLVFSFNPRAIHSAVQQKKTDFPESEANSLLSPVKTLLQQRASYLKELKEEYPYSEPTHPQNHPQNHHEPEQKHSDDAVGRVANLMGMGMGFEKGQCLRALRAASNNADLAVEYLLSGIPQKVQPPTQSEYYQMERAASVIAANNSDPSPVFANLRTVAKKLRKDNKYRTLDTTDPTVTERLMGFDGVLVFLRLLGFEIDHTNTKFVCEEKPSVRTVNNAVDVLNAQWLKRAASDIVAVAYNSDFDTLRTVVKTLRRVAKNLLKDNIKYLTLDTTNPSMRERLIGFEGVLDFLRLLGFENDQSGRKLVCEEKPSVLTVNNAVDVLDMLADIFRLY